MKQRKRAGAREKNTEKQATAAGMKGKKPGIKASMTVEAALVLSLVLFILMGCIKETITWYQQVTGRAGISWVELEDIDRRFRLLYLGRELAE